MKPAGVEGLLSLPPLFLQLIAGLLRGLEAKGREPRISIFMGDCEVPVVEHHLHVGYREDNIVRVGVVLGEKRELKTVGSDQEVGFSASQVHGVCSVC